MHAAVSSVAVEMICYYNLEGLITQRYPCIIHLASGSKNVTLRSIDYLIDKSSGKKKVKKLFGKI